MQQYGPILELALHIRLSVAWSAGDDSWRISESGSFSSIPALISVKSTEIRQSEFFVTRLESVHRNGKQQFACSIMARFF